MDPDRDPIEEEVELKGGGPGLDRRRTGADRSAREGQLELQPLVDRRALDDEVVEPRDPQVLRRLQRPVVDVRPAARGRSVLDDRQRVERRGDVSRDECLRAGRGPHRREHEVEDADAPLTGHRPSRRRGWAPARLARRLRPRRSRRSISAGPRAVRPRVPCPLPRASAIEHTAHGEPNDSGG